MLSTPAPTSSPTNSAFTSQRPKVASIEDDEESDSELLSRSRFVGVSGVSALPVSGVPTYPVSEVPALPALPHAERISVAELKKQ